MSLTVFRGGDLNPRTRSSIERQFNRKPPIETVTASLTITPTHGVILADATAGAVTVTLPPARDAKGTQLTIKKIDASANAVTIDGSGAETIDGSATKSTTTRWVCWVIVSDGSAWFIVN